MSRYQGGEKVGAAVSLRAEYSGRCQCGKRFSSGEIVSWNPETHKIEKCLACIPLRDAPRSGGDGTTADGQPHGSTVKAFRPRTLPSPQRSQQPNHKQDFPLMTPEDWEFMARDPYWKL